MAHSQTLKLFIASVFLLGGFQSSGDAAEIYVSPTGDDQNSGTNPAAPLASLAKARDLARTVAGRETVTIQVADGVYYLPETLVFTADDSGSKEHPIVYRSQNEGGAVLSGGMKINLDWQPHLDGFFKAATPAGLIIDQLFVNGQNQRMARYPNYDPTRKTDAYQGFAADAFSRERAAGWADPTGGYIHAMHQSNWGGYHYRILGKNADGGVDYEGGWQNNRQSSMHKKFRMVENIFEELDAPGEWFHRSETNTLYFKPMVKSDLHTATVEVVRLNHLIEFQGTPDAPVKFITLSGFVFRHAARTFMETKEPLLRSDWAIYRGGSVVLTGTEDISIVDSEFDQVGGNAIFASNYNRRTLVKRCHIHDVGASGVCFVGDPEAVRDPLFEYGQKNNLSEIDRTPGPKTENYPANCSVEDCLIHGIGRVERQPAGVLIEMAMEITVQDCSIYDCARAGINIGDGCWGGHLIERCDVFDTVLETHDHGSFNSWGRDRYWRSDHLDATQKAVDAEPSLPFLDAMKTTVIRNSRWRCDHGWDIDLDDGSSNYDIYNNLLLQGGLKFREGFRRRAWNNITVNNGFHPHVWFNHSEDEVYANIFMVAHRGARMPSDIAKGKRVDGNLFFSPDSGVKDRFIQFGWDVNSIAADPLFVDPVVGDFRVKDGSPAFALGFRNFPMDQFGVKKPSLKRIAKTPMIPTLHERREHRKSKPPAPVDLYWLGTKLSQPKGDEYSAFGVNPTVGGVALADVSESSEAGKHGLRSGDLIQSVNGNAVSNTTQLFASLSGFSSAPLQLKVVRNQQEVSLTVQQHSYVSIETVSAAGDFKRLPVPKARNRKVTANQKTNNDPLSSLVDGRLRRGFGPVFSNGVHSGAYRMDLGESTPIAGITSWSFDQGGRGPQRVTLYGSDAADPSWDLSNYQPLGTIDTTNSPCQTFTAASLQAASEKTLGQFRWILWQVSPVTTIAGGENTAFQELAVDVGVNKMPLSKRVEARPVKIHPSTVNVLSASYGQLDSNWKPFFANHMNLWVAAKSKSTCEIEWKIHAPADGAYDVDVVALVKGAHLKLTCNGQNLEATFAEKNWERLTLGRLRLDAGENVLRLVVDVTKGFRIDALELAMPTVKASMLEEAIAMRQQADWFKEAGYGLMFQWTNRATPPKGQVKPWEEKVNDFDVAAFADMVQESGAGYVVWSITWGQQYISAPIASVDRIIPGRTTKRDLLGEMAEALHQRGVKLIFYYHYGYDCGHSIDADWMTAAGGYEADKTKLFQNLHAILTEVGDRYGDKFSGWWLDGGQRYYDCHFDKSSPSTGILSAPFQQLTQAARTGNPKRLVSYNSWIKPRLTEYQDYFGGEGHTKFDGLKNGIFQAGLQKGLQAHGCFIFEKRWGHIDVNTPIPKPKYDLKQLTALVRQAQEHRYPVSINLEMYEDGSVSPDSIELLKRLRSAVREND